MPFRDRGGGCPTCAIPLASASVRGRDCQRCPSCAGVWISSDVFEELLIETAREGPHPTLSFADRASGRACPECADPMASLLLEHIEVERCARHGIWLDRKELEQAFSMAGEPRWTWTRHRPP